jgi:serine protease Do
MHYTVSAVAVFDGLDVGGASTSSGECEEDEGMRVGSILCVVVLVTPGLLRAGPPEKRTRRTPVVEVFEQCRDAVVNISTTRIQSVRHQSLFDEMFGPFGSPRSTTRSVTSVGSGFVIHERGYIVTNAHVVARASDVQVTFANEATYTAEIVSVDQEHDLAIIRIDADRPLRALEIGHSDDIMIGETVIAIGNPLGLQHTVTSGIVSALDRELNFGARADYSGLIQTDAAINPGNSGGPLLNINGELIGITTAIRGDAQNVGFAIAVDRLWEILPLMLDIERRKRARLGLRVSGAPARVVAVAADSPADQAGLRVGDLITAYNGAAVRNGIDYHVDLLAQDPGDPIDLTYRRRGGDPRRTRVVIKSVPPPDGDALARRLLGIQVSEFPPGVRTRYELPDDLGLLVSGVQRRGPADNADIIVDDLIQSIDRVPVRTIDEIGLVLESVEPGRQVYVEGIRLGANPPFRWHVLLRTADP